MRVRIFDIHILFLCRVDGEGAQVIISGTLMHLILMFVRGRATVHFDAEKRSLVFVATAIISIFTVIERAKGPTATLSQTFIPCFTVLTIL